MKKRILSFIIIFILILSLSPVGFAYTGQGFVAVDNLAVYSGIGQNYSIIEYLPRWTDVDIKSDAGYGWYEIKYNGKTGYVAGYCLLFGSFKDYKPKDTTTVEKPEPERTIDNFSQKIIKTATKYIGVPYKWGGASKKNGGFDCSGLVYRVYKRNGIKLHRIAQDMYKNGVEVSLNNLEIGDILFFGDSIYDIYHVGIYAGDNMMIHASYGESVKKENISELTGLNLIAARRVR